MHIVHFIALQMTHFHIPSADCRMCRLKSVPAHRKTGYPALLCVLQPPLDACRREGAFVFMPLQHQRIYIIRRIFQTVLVQHPRAFCQAHTCQTVILRHNQVPGLHPVDECKITLSAPLSNTSVCAPSRSDTIGCIAQNHNRHTFFSLRSAGSDRPPGSRLHRSKSSCAYSPSLIVLCFGLIIVPCSRCAFQHAGGTHSRRTAKAREAFPEAPGKTSRVLLQ